MADPRELPRRGDLIAGKYRVEHMLGKGGMGVVFRVTHHVTGKNFALKWLLPELAQEPDIASRVLREAQVAGRLQHPNLVEVYDVGSDVNSYYMVMELLEGETLAERVERTGPISPEQAYRYLIPCMRAVAQAHAAEIVHRDLKPANLFVCKPTDSRDEWPKVLDFGISKMSEMSGALDKMTKTGVLMGPPHYMPLEQMRGQPVDRRVDVYAFGVVLYQVLSGHLPYAANSFSDLVLQLASETPKPLDQRVRGLPPLLSRVVARAMARNPEQRYQSLEELIDALLDCGERELGIRNSFRVPTVPNQALSLPTPLATESRVSRSTAGGARRSSAGFWVSGVVLAALAGAGTWWTLTHGLGTVVAPPPTAAAQAEDVPVQPKPSAATPTEPVLTAQPAAPVEPPVAMQQDEAPRPIAQQSPEDALPVPTTRPLDPPVAAPAKTTPPVPPAPPVVKIERVPVVPKLELPKAPIPSDPEPGQNNAKVLPGRRVPTIDPNEF